MKKLLSIALALALCATMVSCNSAAATPAAEQQPAAQPAAQPADQPKAAQAMNLYYASDLDVTISATVDAYKAARPEVDVVKHLIPNDDYDDKLKVLMAGSPADLDAFWIRTPAQTKQYIANNTLEGLSSYTGASGVDLSPIINTALEGAKSEDGSEFFGLPLSASCWLLFYNKGIFDAKGIEYPIDITWDKYKELSKQLTYEEGGTKYWGGVIPPWMYNIGAAAAGEYLTDAEPLPFTRQYTQLLYDLYTGDKSHISLEEMSSGMFDPYAAFASGNVAMTINGDWTFRLLEAPDIEWAAAPLPVFNGVPKGSSVGQSSYFCISTASKNKQTAYEFIEFTTLSDEGTSIIARTDVPSYATDAAMATYKQSVTTPGVEYRFSSLVNLEQGTDPNYGEVNDAFIAEIQLYLLGEEDLDTMFKNFFTLRSEILG